MRTVAPRPAVTPAVAELLDRRAALLDARPPTNGTASEWWAEFPVGDLRCAVRLEALETAIPLSYVRSVPLAPPGTLGLVRHGGELIVALSLASLLGVRGWQKDPSLLLVVKAPGGALVGLDCEKAPAPLALGRDAVAGALAGAEGPLAKLLLPDGALVNLLDVERLLAQQGETPRAE